MNTEFCFCKKQTKNMYMDFPILSHINQRRGCKLLHSTDQLMETGSTSDYNDDLFHTVLHVFLFSDNSVLSVESPSPSIFHITAEPGADKELTDWLKQQGADSETINKVMTLYIMPSWVVFWFVLFLGLPCPRDHPEMWCHSSSPHTSHFSSLLHFPSLSFFLIFLCFSIRFWNVFRLLCVMMIRRIYPELNHLYLNIWCLIFKIIPLLYKPSLNDLIGCANFTIKLCHFTNILCSC